MPALFRMALCGVLCGPAIASGASGFSFTKIADTSDGFNAMGLPSVNSSGLVAFDARGLGEAHVYTGSGGAITDIAAGGNPSINDLGQIAFIRSVVLRYSGGNFTTIYSDPLQSPEYTAIAPSGTVFFTTAGNILGNHSGFASGDGGPVKFYVGPNAVGQAGRPAVNAKGQGIVSYGGGVVSHDYFINFAGGNVLSTMSMGPNGFQLGGPFGDPDVDSAGRFIFSAGAVYVGGGGGALRLIAAGQAECAINDQGVIAALFYPSTDRGNPCWNA